MHPDHAHLLVFPCLPPLSCDFPCKIKKKVHFVLSLNSLEHDQIPSG